ncbi:DUF418 domain-containing protein [Lutimonas vermicola]|uniref:DUF418 domain-containing protein n=1 Tax=Lutimonas vermicola TaxID=414288 RepID=A0ABU9L1X6_9FLAO
MKNNKSLSAPLERITVLDALRGFALFGVIIMHMLQHFGIRNGGAQEAVHRFPVLDEAVQWIGNNIIMGRFINIFAFLFGLSFFIQMDRAAKKGIDFRGRFVWRMIILMAMGLLCQSFYNLEIISVYAFFGLLLIPLFKVKNWLLIAIFSFFLLGGPRTINVIHHNYTTAIELAHIEDQKSTEDQVKTEQQRNDFQSPRELPEHIKNPTFLNTAKFNYKERLPAKLNYQFGLIGRGYITFALFVLGLLIGRIRFFEKLARRKKQNKKLFIGFLLATLIAILIKNTLPSIDFGMLFRPEGQILPSSILTALAMADLSMVLSSAALTLGFILLYQNGKYKKYLEVLSPYGRTGLTNYIMQGALGSLIFSLWAFGSIFGGWGAAALFSFGIVIYIIQGIISKYWLEYYLYGPLEWLWRSLTYLKIQPYVKKKPGQ